MMSELISALMFRTKQEQEMIGFVHSDNNLHKLSWTDLRVIWVKLIWHQNECLYNN